MRSSLPERQERVPHLTMEEHSKVIKAAVEFAKHRVPAAGSGSNCTREAIYLTQEAEEG